MSDPRDLSDKGTLVLALGGNALIRPGQVGTVAQQMENLHEPLRQAARIARSRRLVITHGNGPQVGHLLQLQVQSDDPPPCLWRCWWLRPRGRSGT